VAGRNWAAVVGDGGDRSGERSNREAREKRERKKKAGVGLKILSVTSTGLARLVNIRRKVDDPRHSRRHDSVAPTRLVRLGPTCATSTLGYVPPIFKKVLTDRSGDDRCTVLMISTVERCEGCVAVRYSCQPLWRCEM
jgi:hypothetical protein